MGTGTVPLTWPFSVDVWSITFSAYIAILLGIALAIITFGYMQNK